MKKSRLVVLLIGIISTVFVAFGVNYCLKREVNFYEEKQFCCYAYGNNQRRIVCFGNVYGTDPGMGSVSTGGYLWRCRTSAGLITLIVWRKMEHKEPIQFSGKTILTIVVGVAGALALGVGMCFSMVWINGNRYRDWHGRYCCPAFTNSLFC